MQYSRPSPLFVGDCMPYWHDGIFHFFYLLDEGHHQGGGGYGGHQWVHYSTRDLIKWEEHPIAIPIGPDEAKSICTGSVYFHQGTHYAFHAVRMADYSQHIALSVSKDGIHFEKTQPYPFMAAPPDINRCEFRDPFIFQYKGLFQMLITVKEAEPALEGRGGYVMRMTSVDLKEWQRVDEPFFVSPGAPGYDSVPECPDYFFWKGWYYLIYGSSLRAQYRMSKEPMGPWLRPKNEVVGSRLNAVMKTAQFKDDRRIGTAWIGSRKDDKDAGDIMWGGEAVFREIIQNPDGTLGTKFPEEMVPATGDPVSPKFQGLTHGVAGNPDMVAIHAPVGLGAGYFDQVPQRFRLRCQVSVKEDTRFFGLGFRGTGNYGANYDLRFDCAHGQLFLLKESIPLEGDAAQTCTLDIIVEEDIIDVCIDGRQTIINRCIDLKGDRLFFYCEDGSVRFEKLEFRPLL